MEADLFTVKTGLRPDYYEAFPLFTPDEIVRRAQFLPFHLATLLNPVNISSYVEKVEAHLFDQYLGLSPSSKQELLQSMLVHVGFTQQVARAVSYQRHKFLPADRRTTAYLDTGQAIRGLTSLSAPGVVATMLVEADLIPGSISQVVEIGLGSGFHSIALSMTRPDWRIAGIERDPVSLSIAENNIERVGLSKQLSAHPSEGASAILQRAEYVFSTTALNLEQVVRLSKILQPGTYLTVPRQLSLAEFESEPRDSWLRHTFGTHDHYINGLWNSYVALETGTVSELGIEAVSTIYDLRFVPMEGWFDGSEVVHR